MVNPPLLFVVVFCSLLRNFEWNLEANDVDLCAHTIPVRLMSHAGGLVCNGIYIHMLSIAAAYYRGD